MTDRDSVEILLVEDNMHDGELALRALRKRNLTNRVHWVKDGAEALEFLFARSADGERTLHRTPRVILLDLKLPKVDGLEVLRRLKGDPASRTIPVVVMTSSREETDLMASYQLGVNSYVVKPLDFDKFSDAVAQLGLYWLLLNQIPAPAAS